MATSRSPYKIGLGPKVLARARLILGSLLTLVVIFTVAGIYYEVQSGEFDKILVKPVKQFVSDWKKFAQQTPLPIPEPLVIPTPPATKSTSTSTSTSEVIINQTAPVTKQVRPVVVNCISKNIREGEFASNKCYSQQDYEDLNYYLDKYSSALGIVSFYETKVRISCGNNDFFKTCEQDKKDQQANLDNIPRYKSIIQGIIAKGK